MAFRLNTLQNHFASDHPGNRRDRHIWHFCYLGQHEKCAAYGSLLKDETNPNRTRVTNYRGSSYGTVYCECPCHAAKEVNR